MGARAIPKFLGEFALNLANPQRANFQRAMELEREKYALENQGEMARQSALHQNRLAELEREYQLRGQTVDPTTQLQTMFGAARDSGLPPQARAAAWGEAGMPPLQNPSQVLTQMMPTGVGGKFQPPLAPRNVPDPWQYISPQDQSDMLYKEGLATAAMRPPAPHYPSAEEQEWSAFQAANPTRDELMRRAGAAPPVASTGTDATNQRQTWDLALGTINQILDDAAAMQARDVIGQPMYDKQGSPIMFEPRAPLDAGMRQKLIDARIQGLQAIAPSLFEEPPVDPQKMEEMINGIMQLKSPQERATLKDRLLNDKEYDREMRRSGVGSKALLQEGMRRGLF